MARYRWDGDDLLLRVKVQPRARDNAVARVDDECVTIRLQAPPVDGRANAALEGWLAALFGVRRRNVELVTGRTNRFKVVRISRPSRLPPELRILGRGTAAAPPGSS